MNDVFGVVKPHKHMLAIWAQGLGVRFWCGISVKSLGVGARGLGHTTP